MTMEYFGITCEKFLFLVLVLLEVTFVGVMCGNSTDKTALNAALLNGYNPSVLPGINYSTKLLTIIVGFSLSKIQTFDELTSAFTVTGVLTTSWSDERLTWSPTDYNNITVTYFKQKEIWTPPFILSNSHDVIDLLGNVEMHVKLLQTGEVTRFIPVRLSSSCDANVQYYPFDEQFCTLTLLPWGYNTELVQLRVSDTSQSLREYEGNPVWDLVSMVQESFKPPMVGFAVTITFKRKPLFFMLIFILPIIFMCFVNMLVFMLPAESGERVGFSITVLLAIAVFLSMVSNILPMTSSPQMALLCYLLVSHIALSLLIMICTIVGLRFYLRSEQERVPMWIARVTRIFVPGADRNTTKVCPNPQKTVAVISDTDHDGGGTDAGRSDKPVTWKDVGKAFDRICCIFFFITAMSSNAAFVIGIIG